MVQKNVEATELVEMFSDIGFQKRKFHSIKFYINI